MKKNNVKYNTKICPITEYKENNIIDFDDRLPNINKGSMTVMIAPPQSGKSVLISNLMLNPNMYADKLDEVHIFSPTIFNDKTSRFLKQKYEGTCYDGYSDQIVEKIIRDQEEYEIDERPTLGIILDDIVGLIPTNSKINYLCSRYRHFNIKLLLFSSQLIKGLPPVVRANASNILIFPNSNSNELRKIVEEWAGVVGGQSKFLELYNKVCCEKYQFLHLDLSHTPTRVYKNFEELIHEDKFIPTGVIN